MRVYTIHNTSNGKWDVQIVISEPADYEYTFDSEHGLKMMLDELYNYSPEVVAKTILDSVVDCVAVEVRLLNGPALRLERL